MKERTIIEGKAADGTKLYKIPLGNSDDFALIEATEYHKLRYLGLSGKWSKGHNNSVKAPCSRSRSRYVLVARVMTEAGNQEVVLYRDRNPLNLRRSNLAKKWSPRTDLKNDYQLVTQK